MQEEKKGKGEKKEEREGKIVSNIGKERNVGRKEESIRVKGKEERRKKEEKEGGRKREERKSSESSK